MLELDLTKAKSDLNAKKEFERKREVSFFRSEGNGATKGGWRLA